MPLEEMGSFFNARVDLYEHHMLQDLDSAAVYIEMATLVPAAKGLKLLDLGCGTGLELDEIFKVNPAVQVTGIDLAEKMLAKLRRKHAARKSRLNLILADYFAYDFGQNTYDVALAAETLHHFTPEEKTGLYRKIRVALKPDGLYIESDYVAPDQAFQDARFAESKRLRAEQGIAAGLFHFDTPCTVANQIEMLQKAGFSKVELVSRHGNGATIKAAK
ncbi:MAG: class I SAM-dependent methyltransferase [Dehalococcoidales bacterium]|jgi:tRNA (cmo5U34)-methyltransferase